MKIVTIKQGCDCFTGVPNFISIFQAVYEFSGFETLKIGHTRTHAQTRTTGRQLNITFLDVLVYSEYSHTNISKLIFSMKTFFSFLNKEAKIIRFLCFKH